MIAGSLAFIADNPWKTFGEVPEDWGRRNVVLIIKKGKEEDLGNCKHVSLMFIFGKADAQHIWEHLEKSATKSQHRIVTNK